MLPSSMLNERPPEIGANHTLYMYSNPLKKSYPSRGPTNHRKRSEKGLFSKCPLAQQRWWPMRINFMYACLKPEIWDCLFDCKEIIMSYLEDL